MLDAIKADLAKSRAHFQYSFNKVVQYSFEQEFDEESLETLESFASRFARFSDIIVAKYFRYQARQLDPAFNGSVIDLLNLAEKQAWIDSSQTWKRIRELRNMAAHEYSAMDYRLLYKELVELAPELLKVSF